MISSLLYFLSENLFYFGIGSVVVISFLGVNKKKKKERFARKVLKKTVKSGMTEPMSLHPQIDIAKCAGCGSCTTVCPEGDVLKMINSRAKLVAPTKCVGHGECERACPFGAIDLVFGTKTRGVEIPRVSGDYETNVPGLYIAGELGGMGLIRNAVKQGFLAASHAIKSIQAVSANKTDTDIFIVGAGPAGLSCALTAIAKKKRYMLIEQNSFGGTVYNFPRQKVVMTYPADLPGFGKMKFASNKVSKEELLSYWTTIKKKSGMKVMEQTKFESMENCGDHFLVKTNKGAFTAKKVMLCMGVRGSPRRLGLENEDSPKVAYNLIDPAQYRGADVAVVGGGNAAVEAAQMLAETKYQNRVTLLVRGPTMDRCNEDNKNRIEAMEKQGLVKIWYHCSTKGISEKHVLIDKQGEDVKINNDYLFVFAGAELPFKFLMSLGIEIDKSYGDRKMNSAS